MIKVCHFAYIEDVRTVQQLFNNNLKIIKDFISEKCIRDSLASKSCAGIYNTFIRYCKTNRMAPLSDNTFGVYFNELGIQIALPMVALSSSKVELPRPSMLFRYFLEKNK